MTSDPEPRWIVPALPEQGVVSRFGHDAMACTWELIVIGERASYVEQVAHALFEEIDRLERELSRFIPHSDIARINSLPVGEGMTVGDETLDCLELATELQRETGGVFDVNFRAKRGTVEGSHRPPYGAAASSPVALGFDRRTHRVRKLAPELDLDLGGLGKGYAVDRGVEILREWSLESALLHSGQSTIFALGAPPGRQAWTVTLRAPRGPGPDPGQDSGQVELRDTALAGSGRHVQGDHIVDPRGSRRELATAAWATAPTAAVADALSTTFMLLEMEGGLRYCDSHPTVGGLVFRDSAAPRRFGQFPPLT